MQEPDWNRIQKIYHQALKLPLAEREAFVARATDDPFVMKEVIELLNVSDSTSDFLETPIVELHLTSTRDSLIGTTVNERYYIERKLDAGGMGQLYVARDSRVSGRAVVTKFLSSELLEIESARQMFEDESKALSRIHHQHVVEVLDTGKLDDTPYFVMQFVDGTTLDSHIPNDGMNLERAAAILKQIGAALTHVHEQGVFHRDLKPRNIMLRRGTDSVVLVDFGIALVTDPVLDLDRITDVSAGTLQYMSPEQLNNDEITAASDIYSMAVVAYEMVTGRPPFKASSRSKMLELQRKSAELKPRNFQPDLSPKAQAALLRGLSFKPNDRYRNAKEFGETLARTLLESQRPRKDRQWLRVPMTILFATLLLLSIYIFWIPPEQRRSFDYYLTVQKMRDGQYQDPVKSHGEEMFTTGDKFQLTVLAPEAGYLYIFHEEPPGTNDSSFTMLYPQQTTNDGSASLGADQSVQFDWVTFRGPPGSENLWMIWSPTQVDELESVKAEAFRHPQKALNGQTLLTLKEYLAARRSASDPTTFNYKANQQATVRGKGDPLVTLEQFKHR